MWHGVSEGRANGVVHDRLVLPSGYYTLIVLMKHSPIFIAGSMIISIKGSSHFSSLFLIYL